MRCYILCCTITLWTAVSFAQAPQIVDNLAPNVNVPSFRVSAQPLMKIGGLNDDPRYEILRTGAIALSRNGELIVAPAQSARTAATAGIRIFDAAGRFVRSIGARGSGPGEYLEVTSLASLSPDSLFVYDGVGARLTLFDGRGTVITTLPAARSATCCMAGGHLLVIPPARGGPPRAAAPGAVARDTITLAITNAFGADSVPRNIARLPGREFNVSIGTTAEPGGEMLTELLPRPFASIYFIRLSAESIVYASNDAFEYRVIGRSGQSVRTVRAAMPPIAVPRATADSVRDAFCTGVTGPRRAACASIAGQLNLRPNLPSMRAMFVERDGSVWVQGFQLTPSGQRWLAGFNPSGKLVGVLHFPGDRTVKLVESGKIVLEQLDSVQQATTIYVHRIETITR